MSAAAEFVIERIDTIRKVTWGGFAAFVAALAAVALAGVALAGPYHGTPDTLAFFAFEAAALVGTLAIVLVSVATA